MFQTDGGTERVVRQHDPCGDPEAETPTSLHTAHLLSDAASTGELRKVSPKLVSSSSIRRGEMWSGVFVSCTMRTANMYFYPLGVTARPRRLLWVMQEEGSGGGSASLRQECWLTLRQSFSNLDAQSHIFF